MAMTPRQLVTAQLPTSLGPIYTAASGTKAVVKRAIFTNTTGASATALVHLVPSGGSVSDGNMALNHVSIAAGETLIVSELEGQVIDAGGTIQAQGSVSGALTAILSGVEIT